MKIFLVNIVMLIWSIDHYYRYNKPDADGNRVSDRYTDYEEYNTIPGYIIMNIAFLVFTTLGYFWCN